MKMCFLIETAIKQKNVLLICLFASINVRLCGITIMTYQLEYLLPFKHAKNHSVFMTLDFHSAQCQM